MEEINMLGVAILVASFIYLVVVAILILAGIWKVYKKMGQPGWVYLIPIYGTYVLNTKVQKRNPWLVLIDVAGIINIVAALINGRGICYWTIVIICWLYHIILTNGISKGFKRGKWFTCGLILIPVIFYPILGFSKDEFYKEVFEKNIEK